MASDTEDLLIIEYHMLNLRKYTPLILVSSVGVRTLLYPLTLIRTRLQVQQGRTLYKGTADAFLKIFRNEGFFGLYRGFPVHLLQIPSSFCYINAYELTRSKLETSKYFSNSYLRSFIGGALASFIGQSITVPVDIVSQHMQVLGQRKGKATENVKKKLNTLQRLSLPDNVKHSRFGAVHMITSEIYRIDGIRGFYRGYFMSLSVFVPGSALWWPLYNVYFDVLNGFIPDSVPRLITQGMSAVCGGLTTAIFTNPLDIFRARMQICHVVFHQRKKLIESLTQISNTLVEGTDFKTMWNVLKNERRWYTKGLSARLISSFTFSLIISISYETVKKLSIKDEYKDRIRW